jgi:hypothetical protein
MKTKFSQGKTGMMRQWQRWPVSFLRILTASENKDLTPENNKDLTPFENRTEHWPSHEH